MGDILKDERFLHISSDPRFKRPSKASRKVKIDKRFQSIFSDKHFQVKYTVDKRGRPVKQSSLENYRRYYNLSSDDDESDGQDSDYDTEKETGNGEKAILEKEKSDRSLKKKKEEEPKRKVSKVRRVSDKDEIKCNEGERFVNDFEPDKETSAGFEEDFDGQGSDSGDIDTDDGVGEQEKTAALKLPKDVRDKLHDLSVDYARGMGNLMSDSSSSSSDDDDSFVDGGVKDVEEYEHDWGELDKDAERTGDATNRLAICNMDWDRIRAVDLMVLCTSFLPPGGLIQSVTVYPSEFGMERMKEEEVKGPIELAGLKEAAEKEIDLEQEDESGQNYHMERLRKYQLMRLKYYYAVVVCNSIDTASTLYNECDGLEYESSATKLDLRFIPDGVTFEQEPREVCTELSSIGTYQPRMFLNTALQQGKVECTWDETDPARVQLAQKLRQMKGADNINENDLQGLVASSSDDNEETDPESLESLKSGSGSKGGGGGGVEAVDEEEEECRRTGNGRRMDRYRRLLSKIEEEREKKRERDVEMEITWGVGLKERTRSLVDRKLKEAGGEQMTPFERLVGKKREKRLKNREEKNSADRKTTKGDKSDEENDAGVEDASSDSDIPDGVDMNDDYFREELEGGTSSKKKKKKKNKGGDVNSDDERSFQRKTTELELLVMDEGNGRFSLKKAMENDGGGKEVGEKRKRKGRKQLMKKRKKEQESKQEDSCFKVDVTDERFGALYTSHHFNIDPADSHFHKTKGMEAFIKEKIDRKVKEDNFDKIPDKKRKVHSLEMSKIVSSIKTKTRQANVKR